MGAGSDPSGVMAKEQRSGVRPMALPATHTLPRPSPCGLPQGLGARVGLWAVTVPAGPWTPPAPRARGPAERACQEGLSGDTVSPSAPHLGLEPPSLSRILPGGTPYRGPAPALPTSPQGQSPQSGEFWALPKGSRPKATRLQESTEGCSSHCVGRSQGSLAPGLDGGPQEAASLCPCPST